MNVARAVFGVGENREVIEGDPSYVLLEMASNEGPVEFLEFEFDKGRVQITKDNDVLGEIKGVEHTAFMLKKIVVTHGSKKNEFCDINEAIEFARNHDVKDFEFDICAVTPQGKKSVKGNFRELVIDVDDSECDKCKVTEK